MFPIEWNKIVDQLEEMDKELFLTIQRGNNREQEGLCILGIAEQTAKIVHLSTKDRDFFGGALTLVCEYIFNDSGIERLEFK